MAPFRPVPTLAPLLATFAALACAGDALILPSPQLESASNSTVSADPTSIQAGFGTSTIRVTVRDEAGAPITGATVSLSASGTGNTLTQPGGPTGSDGVATGTLQSTVPGMKDVTATVNGSTQLNQAAQIAVVVASATRIELAEGNDQSARSGDPVPVPPAVRVTDASGHPVAGVTVTFVVTGGGGSVTGGTQTTGSEGIARVGSWTLSSPGANTLEAQAGSLDGSPVLFSATATSPPPPPSGDRIQLVEGNDQSARSGDAVPVPPAVRVTDVSGQPVAGVTVTFVVTGGGGSVTGATQTTSSEGIARVGSWTLGSPGANTLEARAGSLDGSPVLFSATATSPPPPPPPPSGAPHHLVFQVPPQNVDRNEEFMLKVAIVDADGNVVPLSGIEIYLGLFQERHDSPSNKFLAGERFRDTEDGVATFNLRITHKGRYRVRALTDELPGFGQGGPQPYLFSGVFEVDK